MKVALLLQFYFPYGGLQRDCLSMARELLARGVEVTIVTRSWKGGRPKGIEIIVLGARGIRNVVMDQNFDHDVSVWLSDKKYDATVSFSRLLTPVDFYYAADPCYRLKIKRDRSVVYQRSSKYQHHAGLESQIFSAGSPTQLFLLTEMEFSEYQKFYGTEPQRVHILPPSIQKRNLDVLGKTTLRKSVRLKMGWRDDEAVVVFVGSGFATKGLDRAIIACAEVDEDLKFCVIGDGKSGKYEKIAKKWGGDSRVEFMGARDDAWELMVAADLLIHPARSENTGTVLVESLSAGTGVLTTDRCGFANHIAAAGAGTVLPSPFDQGELNLRLKKLLSESWEERARKALEYAESENLYSGMEMAVQCVIDFAHACS